MRTLLAPLLFAGLATAAVAHDGVHHDPNLPAATKAQIHEVAAAVQRYRDFAVAEREGWRRFGGDEPLMGEHWFLPERGPDYVGADARIDWSRPSNLMYTDIGGRKVLTGVAFTVRLAPGEALPAGFAGSADRWHVHDFERALAAALQDRPLLRWLANGWINDNYKSKGDDRGRVAMVHAWVTLPNPDGVFANYNRTVPYLKLGLPAAWADGASVDAARGLHLATANGCPDVMDGRLWIANVGGKETRALRKACADAAAHVRQGLETRDPARANAMAEHGWRLFDRAWNRTLTRAQHARIAAMGEHDSHEDGHRESEPARSHDDHGTGHDQ